MTLNFKTIGIAVSSLATVGVSLLVYELNRPKTVKELVEWKGFTLASAEDDNIWKALFFQNQKDLSPKVKDFEALRKSCFDLWNKSIDYQKNNHEYVEKYCTNVLKSRKARIIANGFDEGKFLSSAEDYKTAFIVNRNSAGFRALLNKPDITKDSEIDEADNNLYEAYKKYCEDALQEDSQQIVLVQQVCQKHPYLTAEQMANQDGYSDKSEDVVVKEWEKEFKAVEGTNKNIVDSSLLKDISKSEENWKELISNKDLFVQKFKDWCGTQKAMHLYKKGFYNDIYPRYTARCMVKTDPSKKLTHPLSPKG